MGLALAGGNRGREWHYMVNIVSYTGPEKARILRTARQTVRNKDNPFGPPLPAPPPFEIKYEDAVEKWKRLANEDTRKREQADARRKREERADKVARIRAKQNNELAERVSALEERVSALELVVSDLNDAANGAATFSSNTVARLQELATLARKLDGTLETMRAVHRREVDGLRDRLASSEASHGRETAVLMAKLADAQREIDHRADIREHARTRMQIAGVNENLENVVALVREDIASRS